jgi:hypothetical protein
MSVLKLHTFTRSEVRIIPSFYSFQAHSLRVWSDISCTLISPQAGMKKQKEGADWSKTSPSLAAEQ